MQQHIPVLQSEVIENLSPKPNENFIDCTLGYAGHASEILKKTGPSGQLLGIDQDKVALKEAQKTLEQFNNRVTLVKSNFTKLGLLIRDWKVDHVDGILIDLGASTNQLTGERGFSFRVDAPLDMRMNPETGDKSARAIINDFSESQIAKILFEGEESFARQIAKKIVQKRKEKPIETTFDLVAVIKQALPPSYRFNQKTHFATGTFRALRMAVNKELESLELVLPQAVQILSPGGRIAVITFHSLEDRIVKNFFRSQNLLEIKTAKPIMPTESEVNQNHASRSAKLRVAIKV